MLLSVLYSHSDGTHTAEDEETDEVLINKQNHLHLEWPNGEYIFSIFISG